MLGANVSKGGIYTLPLFSTASNKHGRISPHVAVPGCELVPTVTVHALRKLIAAGTGSGHLVQSRQYWAACLVRLPPPPHASEYRYVTLGLQPTISHVTCDVT